MASRQTTKQGDPARNSTILEGGSAGDAAKTRASTTGTGPPQLDTTQRGHSFQLIASGEIQGAEINTSNPLMCTFSFQSGVDWTVTEGATSGITQLSASSIDAESFDPKVVWNFPFGFALKATSAFGWPRLVVSVYGNDMCNRRVIRGYGSVHVPCQPGRHERKIRLFKPVSSSLWVRFLGYITGNPAQFIDPRVACRPEGREMVRVASGGKLTVVFNVMVKDMKRFNYVVA